MERQTQLNHTEYMKKVKTLTIEQLQYIIKDAREALECLPWSHKAGWYQDEIHYCHMELVRRKEKHKK
jgi:hypothetical protein